MVKGDPRAGEQILVSAPMADISAVRARPCRFASATCHRHRHAGRAFDSFLVLPQLALIVNSRGSDENSTRTRSVDLDTRLPR